MLVCVCPGCEVIRGWRTLEGPILALRLKTIKNYHFFINSGAFGELGRGGGVKLRLLVCV